MALAPSLLEPSSKIAELDLIEVYFERGWTDGLPVVPPTPDKINAVVEVLGGDLEFVECKVAPRWGTLTREVLAINMVMAGCKPEYAPVSGNRANATIGRAIRLIMLNVGGGSAPYLDKCTLGNPAKYTYCVCENEEQSALSPYHVEQGYRSEQATVFAIAA